MLNCLEKAKVTAITDVSDIDNIENINPGKEWFLSKTRKEARLFLYSFYQKISFV